MPNTEDNFKWDESLIKEMIWAKLPIPDHYVGNVQKCLDEFKKSKQPVFDYEILSVKDVDSDKILDMEYRGMYNPDYYKIHSVKRLSDNEVFTIGDKIEGFGETPVITIEKFQIDAFDSTRISAYHNNGYGKGIAAWNKVKERIPLFTSDDNVPIYEGDKIFPVSRKYDYTEVEITAGDWLRHSKTNKWFLGYFSTEEAAKEYVLMNKPCLTAKEVIDLFFSEEYFQSEKSFDTLLKELAKQKINGI